MVLEAVVEGEFAEAVVVLDLAGEEALVRSCAVLRFLHADLRVAVGHHLDAVAERIGAVQVFVAHGYRVIGIAHQTLDESEAAVALVQYVGQAVAHAQLERVGIAGGEQPLRLGAFGHNQVAVVGHGLVLLAGVSRKVQGHLKVQDRRSGQGFQRVGVAVKTGCVKLEGRVALHVAERVAEV